MNKNSTIKALDGRDHAISINSTTESLASSLEKLMGEDSTFMPSRCCIFKTPSILYRHKEQAYIPNAFSIGPFHHGKPNLTHTEKIKLKYLQGLISRSHSQASLRQCFDVILEVEEEARECYAGTIGFSPDEFVKILVLDACFIIELFRKDAGLAAKDEDDPVFTMSCMLQFLYHDLILLENQIPWLVLERVFRLTASPSESKSLVELTLEFFGNIFSSDKHSIEPHLFANQEIKHILDLLRKSLLLPSRGEDNHHCFGWQPFPSATSIKEAGIKFRKVASSSILDIRFSNGILEMPSLLIQETTETIFRNLISFEQCYPNCTPRVTSYAIILSHLISTPKDMDILCDNEIIDNWLIPEDSAKFFKTLYHDSYVKEFHYLRLCEQVNGYCHHWWSRWHASYRHNYFGKPWAIVSLFAAATLLILTFIQTYYIVFK
ncbi:PREDICTED: UPF0481 protein At3g47200 [Theobroma cacao]|uniref:UPF0481 protein At3g47200 n=1 Tax=Theobroma cacao TaxID=3641 RepID=A0AB32W6L3_THECC|nr:PREDICTED: UPF0481 protein At3g47200 [Theobroma cacao]